MTQTGATQAGKTQAMKRILALMMGIIAVVLAVLGGRASSAKDKQDKYTLKVPGGLAFSEFGGYETWQVVSISEDGGLIAAILANPAGDRKSGQVLVRTLGGKNSNQMRLGRRSGTTISQWQSRGMRVAPTAIEKADRFWFAP